MLRVVEDRWGGLVLHVGLLGLSLCSERDRRLLLRTR